MSTARTPRVLVALAIASCPWVASATGCSREPAAAETTRGEPATATLPRPQAHEYELTAGAAELAFGPPARSLRGRLPLTHGRLWLDMAELGATRAVLTFDLAGLVIDETPGPSVPSPLESGRSLTEQSLDWLELNPARLAAAPERRFARFEVSSFVPDDVAGRSGPAAVVAAPRRVRGRATGDLELHGYRLPYTVVVIATPSWPDGASFRDPPRRVEVVLAEPLGIDPLRHEIVPRESGGEVRSSALSELRKLPSNTVRVSGRWVAEAVEQSSHR